LGEGGESGQEYRSITEGKMNDGLGFRHKRKP